MSRKDALIKLHERLTQKRNSLRKKLSVHTNLPKQRRLGVGDVVDMANRGTASELNTKLAALESRELRQIEQAMEMIREGRYGRCFVCDNSIPITRLKALPFTPCCIGCQRELEAEGGDELEQAMNWENAYEQEGRRNDAELTLRDLNID